jgi:hypothetical protein
MDCSRPPQSPLRAQLAGCMGAEPRICRSARRMSTSCMIDGSVAGVVISSRTDSDGQGRSSGSVKSIAPKCHTRPRRSAAPATLQFIVRDLLTAMTIDSDCDFSRRGAGGRPSQRACQLIGQGYQHVERRRHPRVFRVPQTGALRVVTSLFRRSSSETWFSFRSAPKSSLSRPQP